MLLPDALLPLADSLEKAGVAIDSDNVGIEHIDPQTGAVDCVFELYWPESNLAVSLDCEGRQLDEITVLHVQPEIDQQGVEALAEQIIETLKHRKQ